LLGNGVADLQPQCLPFRFFDLVKSAEIAADPVDHLDVPRILH